MMTTNELLLTQVRMYLALAKSLQSKYYLSRAKATLKLFYERQKDKTAIIKPAA